MVIKEFKYLKSGEEQPKDYELLVLREDVEHEMGIATSYLNEEQKEELIQIVNNFETALKPFMKFYRSFKKDNIIAS